MSETTYSFSSPQPSRTLFSPPSSFNKVSKISPCDFPSWEVYFKVDFLFFFSLCARLTPSQRGAGGSGNPARGSARRGAHAGSANVACDEFCRAQPPAQPSRRLDKRIFSCLRWAGGCPACSGFANRSGEYLGPKAACPDPQRGSAAPRGDAKPAPAARRGQRSPPLCPMDHPTGRTHTSAPGTAPPSLSPSTDQYDHHKPAPVPSPRDTIPSSSALWGLVTIIN